MPNNENLGANFSIDVTNLKAGLSQANRLIRESESEFKSAAAGMDDWTKKEEGLTAKIKSLNQITDVQQKKVNALQAQYSDLIKKGLDPTSKEAVELRTKINNETAALEKNKKQTKELETKLTEFRDEAKKTGKTVDEVAQDIDDMGDEAGKAKEGFTTLRGAVATFAGNALTNLVSKLGEAATSLASLSQETQEYREDIGKLETAFEAAGKSTDLATKTYKDFYSVLGEEDRSVEAVNHLAKLVDTEEDMATWTDIAAGVWGTFGDSLPIEGLTEASNETAKVGKLTGVLADALNWAGVNEDDFQASLDKCNSEQERSRLITDTLNGLYSEAAALYKKNNKSVIEARKATSDYTDTMADLGDAIEPVNTEITSLKNDLAKEVAPVLKNKVIPSCQKFIKELKNKGVVEKFGKAVEFVTDNAKGLAIAAGAAVIAIKGMAIGTAIAKVISGVTTAIQLATAGQWAWNAAMVANPIGAVITAVAALAAGIALLVVSMKDATESTDLLSESQRETVTSAQEAAEAYRENKAAADEMAAAELANIDYTQSLWKELQTLADENGKVKEGYEGRAEFILGQLNEALGTEYEMNGNIIQSYQDIEKSIGDVINAKKAQILLEAYEDTYREAVEKVAEAEKARAIQAQELSAQQEVYDEASQKAITARMELEQKAADAKTESAARALASEAKYVEGLEREAEKQKGILDEKEKEYSDSQSALYGYYKDISDYETASTLVLEGETEKAVGYLNNLGSEFKTVASTAKLSADEQKEVLEQQVIDTEVNARLMKAAYEKGVEGVTEQMVKTASEQAEKAKEEFHSIGGNITKGIGEGAEAEKWTLSGTMTRLIDSAVSAAKKAAGIQSPSKLFRDEVGKFISAGVSVGIDKGTGGVVKSVKRQISAIRKAYNVDGIADKLTTVKGNLVTMRNSRSANVQTAPAAPVPAANKSFTVNQYNNYSQEHSRYEMWKSEQNTKAAVKLILLEGE